jgi:hypothetical protein
MANWQATLLNGVLTNGSVLVISRDQVDESEVPTLRTGDTFYGSVPDGDPFGGTAVEVKGGHAIVEVGQKQHRMHKAQPHEANDDASIAGPHETWVVE